MAVGILIGGMDRIFGNKFGLGEQFEEGFNAMGPLALGMVRIVTLAPVIAKVLGPIIIPVFTIMGSIAISTMFVKDLKYEIEQSKKMELENASHKNILKG